MYERDNYWLRRRLTRRRALQGSAAGLAGAAGLALVGCGGDDDDDDDGTPQATATRPGFATPQPTSTIQSGEVNKDGILRLRQNAIWSSINPYKGLDSGLTWGFTIFDHLWYTPRDTGVPELLLAESLERPDDGSQITAKLKPSVFHDKPPIDGRAVTAQDVKASLEAAAVQTGISNSSWWSLVFDGVDAPDESTVVIKMKALDAWTMTSTNGGSPIASSVIPEEIAADPDFMDRDLIGSGRFQFLSHENGTNFRIRRHPNWRVEGEPWLAGQDWKLVQEQAAAIAAFSADEIDSVALQNRLERDELLQQLGDSINMEENVTAAVWTFQGRADGVWADPRVRKAVNQGLDREQLIQLMAFGDGVLSGPVPPPFVDQSLPETELLDTWSKHDPADSNALLDAAEFDRSVRYELKYPLLGELYSQFAQVTAQQLRTNLGLNIQVVPEDFSTWLQQSLYGSNYSGFVAYPSLAYDDPSSYIGAYAKEIGGRPNWARFIDDEMDDLYVQQKAILDDEARFQALLDIQRKAYEKAAPYWPTFVRITNTAWHKRVQGRITGRGSFGLLNGRVYIDDNA